MKFDRIAVIVLDSVGIGELPDAEAFGDVGSHTLGHIAERVSGIRLPNLRRWGLDRIAPIGSWEASAQPAAAYYSKMAEVSVGKDTMTGHWELMGLKLTVPFQTFPEGFPAELISAFEERTAARLLATSRQAALKYWTSWARSKWKQGPGSCILLPTVCFSLRHMRTLFRWRSCTALAK